MTVELEMLVYVSILSVVMALPPLVALTVENGLGVAARNRDEVPHARQELFRLRSLPPPHLDVDQAVRFLSVP